MKKLGPLPQGSMEKEARLLQMKGCPCTLDEHQKSQGTPGPVPHSTPHQNCQTVSYFHNFSLSPATSKSCPNPMCSHAVKMLQFLKQPVLMHTEF